MSKNIAVDGPSGAGKSTLSRMIARKFGLIYVDTGAMYRTVGLYVLRHGLDSHDKEGVVSLLPDIHVAMRYDDSGVQRMLLNGEDVSEEIRLPGVSIYASDVSAMPEVRSFLLHLQRKPAEENSVIMDGRDIGTVVLPDAGLKIFLSATPEDRARRRYEELLLKGVKTTPEDVLRDINYRDVNDSTRAAAPLRPAEGAVILDTTGNTLEESFETISRLVKAYLDGGDGE
jgi:cytidylate kinase